VNVGNDSVATERVDDVAAGTQILRECPCCDFVRIRKPSFRGEEAVYQIADR
jgi:hypothetical protein